MSPIQDPPPRDLSPIPPIHLDPYITGLVTENERLKQSQADLLAALEEARVVLSGAAFGSWAQENRRPELRVAYDHIDAAIAAAHQGEGTP